MRPPGNGTAIQDPIRDPLARYPAHHAAITATGLLEHLTKPEVFQTFDDVAAALAPGGARVTIWQVVSACYRIALAAETGMLRGHIVTRNLTLAARRQR